MIKLVDAYILDRLGRIKCSAGVPPVVQPMPIHGLGPDREKGEMIPPCISLSRYMKARIDLDACRNHLEYFTPSDEQVTVTIPETEFGGGEFIGPASWEWKWWPIPLELFYQVDCYSVADDQDTALFLMLLEAFPVPFRLQIDGNKFGAPLMISTGSPEDLDELEKPFYRTAVRYRVSNVWVERQAAFQALGIREFDLQIGV